MVQQVLGEGSSAIVGFHACLDEINRLSRDGFEWLVMEMVSSQEDRGDHRPFRGVVVHWREDLLQVGRWLARTMRRGGGGGGRVLLEGEGVEGVGEGLVDLHPLEGSSAGQEDVGDHPDGPDIAPLVITLPEHLRGSGVGSAHHFLQRSAAEESHGIAEVDQFDLRIWRVALQKDVL